MQNENFATENYYMSNRKVTNYLVKYVLIINKKARKTTECDHKSQAFEISIL